MEKKNEEKKNTLIEIMKYVLPLVAAVLLFCIIKFGILGRAYKLEEVGVEKYTSLVSRNKNTLVYFVTDDCESCNEVEDMFKKVLKGSKIKLYKVNVSKLTDTETSSFMEVLDITRESVETPLVVLTNDKQVISTYRAPFYEEGFISFLEENNLVK